MLYLGGAFGGQDYRYDVESERTIVYIVGCDKVAGCFGELLSLGMRDGLLGRAEAFVGSRFDLDEHQTRIGIDHDQIDFPGIAGEIAGESLEAFCSQEFFTAFLAPSPELLHIGQESATI